MDLYEYIDEREKDTPLDTKEDIKESYIKILKEVIKVRDRLDIIENKVSDFHPTHARLIKLENLSKNIKNDEVEEEEEELKWEIVKQNSIYLPYNRCCWYCTLI